MGSSYFKLKYSSIQRVIASMRTKLSKFPTPKNKRTEKSVREMATTRPRLELAKISEAVKRIAVKNVIKKRGITPKVLGSTK